MNAAAPSQFGEPRVVVSSTLSWSGYALGFALGGFFDGILLHQVLQWHHLLSGLESGLFQDLRIQILADGLFHLLMYLVGAIGLGLLWRTRRELAFSPADRRLMGNGLIGFGAWHIIDAVVSHWVTGIHRIRMDSDVPLVWDLGWFAAFGLVPFAIGLLVRSRGGGGGSHFRGTAAAGLVMLVVSGAAVSAFPPRSTETSIAVFRPGLGPSDIVRAAHSLGGKVIWSDASGGVWAFAFEDPAQSRRLYGRGALLVSNAILPVGCLGWSRIRGA